MGYKYDVQVENDPGLPLGSNTVFSDSIALSLLTGKISIQYIHSSFLAALLVVEDVAVGKNPGSIQVTGHGLTTGQTVTVTGVNDPASANQTTTITVTDDDNFDLDGWDADLEVPYTSGGNVATPVGSISVTVQGSMDNETFVDLVAAVADPTEAFDAPAWPYIRLKGVITDGNYDSYKFYILEISNS